jgi:hypothetical protein
LPHPRTIVPIDPKGCAGISTAYDQYFFQYQRAMNDATVGKALASESAQTLSSRAACADLLSPYTVVRVTALGGDDYEFAAEPYAVFFGAVLPPIFQAFETCVAALRQVPGGAVGDKAAMALFLEHFRSALGETTPSALETTWAKCDELWMDVQGPLQVVHDIEDGYSDPLRAKQGPDFSLRFLDSTVICSSNLSARITCSIVHPHPRPSRFAPAAD